MILDAHIWDMRINEDIACPDVIIRSVPVDTQSDVTIFTP
jgi:hypothetical protein